MSTTFLKKETVQRKWYVLDAAGKPLGRTAVVAAKLLRGKHRPDFTPNVDCGDFVIILNTDQAVLTGNKGEQKLYRRVSGWIGGLKETKARLMMEKRSDNALNLPSRGCRPRTSLARAPRPRRRPSKARDPTTPPRSPKPGTLD